jgi:hypothetical protein
MSASVPVVPVITGYTSQNYNSPGGFWQPYNYTPIATSPAGTSTTYTTHGYIKEVLLDGPRYFIGHWVLISDGSSGELVNFPILDPRLDFQQKAFQPYSAGLQQKLTLTNVFFSGTQNFSAVLSWDDVPPRPFWIMASQMASEVNLWPVGGISDRTDPITDTHRVLISTQGLSRSYPLGAGSGAPISGQCSFVLKFRKD